MCAGMARGAEYFQVMLHGSGAQRRETSSVPAPTGARSGEGGYRGRKGVPALSSSILGYDQEETTPNCPAYLQGPYPIPNHGKIERFHHRIAQH